MSIAQININNRNTDYWEVYIAQNGGVIEVRPICKSQAIYNYKHLKTVSSPNWLEMKLGITFESKLNKAIINTKKICDNWNRKVDKAKIQMELINCMK